jgi:hypothetical protein
MKTVLLGFVLTCTLGSRITCLTVEDIWCYKTVIEVDARNCTSRLLCWNSKDRELLIMKETQEAYEHTKQEYSRTCQIFSYDELNL